jgi:hypothetical protein
MEIVDKFFCWIKEHLEPCCVILLRTMQAWKTCVGQSSIGRWAGDVGGGMRGGRTGAEAKTWKLFSLEDSGARFEIKLGTWQGKNSAMFDGGA